MTTKPFIIHICCTHEDTTALCGWVANDLGIPNDAGRMTYREWARYTDNLYVTCRECINHPDLPLAALASVGEDTPPWSVRKIRYYGDVVI